MSPKRLLAGLLALIALGPATVAPTIAEAAPAKGGPAVLVIATPQGSHVVGRPGAANKLVEYVSYTCPHCAAFEKEGAPVLMLTAIRPGRMSVEYRPFMRNIVDVAATLMVGCGAPSRFPGNHVAVLRGQETWFKPPSEDAQQRWRTGDFGTRMRAVAADMNLYPIFTARGYARAELDRCLANEQLANALSAENAKAIEELKLQGTPSFLLGGKLLPAHDWASLKPALGEITK